MSCRECDFKDYPQEYEYGYSVGYKTNNQGNPFKENTEEADNWFSGWSEGRARKEKEQNDGC